MDCYADGAEMFLCDVNEFVKRYGTMASDLLNKFGTSYFRASDIFRSLKKKGETKRVGRGLSNNIGWVQ